MKPEYHQLPEYGQNPHGRQSIRLPDYDYSQPGAYFVTTVTRERECLFGWIDNLGMHLNEAGQIVWEIWNLLPARYPQVSTGMAVVMPNHFHGIIEIHESSVGAVHELPLHDRQSRRRMTIPLVVGYFKMNTAKLISNIMKSEGIQLWQRNYYEHSIRDEEEHNRIHLYIEANIDNWATDEENPVVASGSMRSHQGTV